MDTEVKGLAWQLPPTPWSWGPSVLTSASPWTEAATPQWRGATIAKESADVHPANQQISCAGRALRGRALRRRV